VRRKGEFALALAERIAEARAANSPVTVPAHFASMFEFLYPGTAEQPPAEGSDELSAGTAAAPPRSVNAPERDDAASPPTYGPQ